MDCVLILFQLFNSAILYLFHLFFFRYDTRTVLNLYLSFLTTPLKQLSNNVTCKVSWLPYF